MQLPRRGSIIKNDSGNTHYGPLLAKQPKLTNLRESLCWLKARWIVSGPSIIWPLFMGILACYYRPHIYCRWMLRCSHRYFCCLVLSVLSGNLACRENLITQQQRFQQYEVMTTPIGATINISHFYSPATARAVLDHGAECHNVNKNMIAQDMSLIPLEVIIAARVASATALSYIVAQWPASVCLHINSCPYPEVLTRSRAGLLSRRNVPPNPHALHRFTQHAAEVSGGRHRRTMGSRI